MPLHTRGGRDAGFVSRACATVRATDVLRQVYLQEDHMCCVASGIATKKDLLHFGSNLQLLVLETLYRERM